MACPHGYIETLAKLAGYGKPFVSVTLVDAHGSVPQEIGSKMLVDASGLVFGTVGGGRIEAAAIAQSHQLLSQRPCAIPTRCVQWSLKRDLGMTCGGSVTLFFEAFQHRKWSIVIFGAGHVANALVECLIKLDCNLTVIDSRQDWLDKMPAEPHLQKQCLEDPVDFVMRLPADAYVLLMTMGHRTDRPILEAILKSQVEFPYLGVIGSAGKRGALRKELLLSGLSAERADAFRCPIGLKLGNNEPQEIAISVAAELLQVRDAYCISLLGSA